MSRLLGHYFKSIDAVRKVGLKSNLGRVELFHLISVDSENPLRVTN